MPLLDKFRQRVKALVQDTAGKLPDEDRDALVAKAIVQRYSKDRPREVVTDVAGNGTPDLPLPQGSGGEAFEEEFSLIRQLEYPIGEVPPELLENYEWTFYRAPAGLKLRLTSVTPSAAESVRVTWTTRHKDDGSTVPACDFDAVCDLAASHCFAALAAAYAQTGDNSIGADIVNYRSKGQEYANLSKAALKRYLAHVGATEDALDNASDGPAIATGDFDLNMAWGGDRMTHRRPR